MKQSILTEFPSFEMGVLLPKGYLDSSWHNNACPSFDYDFGESFIMYRIWVDYKNIFDREGQTPNRFSICSYSKYEAKGEISIGDHLTTLIVTNDWHEIVATLEYLRFISTRQFNPTILVAPNTYVPRFTYHGGYHIAITKDADLIVTINNVTQITRNLYEAENILWNHIKEQV